MHCCALFTKPERDCGARCMLNVTDGTAGPARARMAQCRITQQTQPYQGGNGRQLSAGHECRCSAAIHTPHRVAVQAALGALAPHMPPHRPHPQPHVFPPQACVRGSAPHSMRAGSLVRSTGSPNRFYSFSATPHEYSIVLEESAVPSLPPQATVADGQWRVIQVRGLQCRRRAGALRIAGA